MKTKFIWAPILLICVLLVLSIGTFAFAQDSTDSQPDDPASAARQGTADLGSDSNPAAEPEVLIPDQYQPELLNEANGVAELEVYFTPQDENSSTTVLFLYNTSVVTATVGIETFQLDGSPFINTSVAVPPANLVRISADSISSVSTTWQDVVLINFTTFSTYARLTLPAGVKADGYVVWNDASTYDPLQVAPTLPLRFSIDPPTVFLPTTHRN